MKNICQKLGVLHETRRLTRRTTTNCEVLDQSG